MKNFLGVTPRLRITPEPHMREGYAMVFLNAADDYVRAIFHEDDAAGE